ncbi:MAG: McrC family protein [Methanosarcinaceae archaeon]
MNHIQMNMLNTENIINLFEYSNQESFDGEAETLEAFLDDIWKLRHNQDFSYMDISEDDDYDSSIASKQKFLTFLKDGSIKSRKYVGVIKYNEHTINLLPKIFYDKAEDKQSAQNIDAIHTNMLWWLSYCRKIKFPKSKTGLNSIKSSFFDILIYIFANYTRQLLNKYLYHSYTEVNNELGYMKGRLDVNAYITNNISKGKWHKLSCTYDSFEFDNMFNRIIKYVVNLMLGSTKNSENKKLLDEILFILDEVTDINAVYEDCSKVKLNPLYEDMHTVLDYCRLFLGNSVTFSYKNQFKVFAFLLPMEYVFEDFIFGFLGKHRKKIPGIRKLTSQKSDLYLAKLYENDNMVSDPVFNLQQDIYFEYNNKKIIADVKYKLTYTSGAISKAEENKHGVKQSDLYQMISYAIRRKTSDILLIYPQTLSVQFGEKEKKSVMFSVHDEFAGKNININIVKLSVIHQSFPDIDKSITLQKNFAETEAALLDELIKTFELLDEGIRQSSEFRP